MTLFLFRERVPGEARYAIQALADFEVGGPAEREELLDYAVGRDFLIVKILAVPAHAPSPPELDFIFERLGRYSERQAQRLRSEFEGLVAVGDIVDITRRVNELRYFVQ
jgi:hypothetical protein